MPNETQTTQTTETTPTSYDLISINGVAAPDVIKGSLVVAPNWKYKEYDTEDGGKVIEVITSSKLRGSVSYNGLFQTQISAISSALLPVSTLVVYNPMTGSSKTMTALIVPNEMEKKIHDGRANAWSFGFTFEEI